MSDHLNVNVIYLKNIGQKNASVIKIALIQIQNQYLIFVKRKNLMMRILVIMIGPMTTILPHMGITNHLI